MSEAFFILVTLDWQIFIEADYIANATENGYSETNVKNFIQKIIKTDSGKSLAKDVFRAKSR